jgi:hypothetical protein
LIGKTEIPLQDQVLALRIADDPLAVTPELRVVRWQQKQPCKNPLAELLYHGPVAELGVDAPVGRYRPEVHDSDVTPRGALRLC